MSKELIEHLRDPDIHFPGNFDTVKRANAMLMCLCQEAADALESQAEKLTAYEVLVAQYEADAESQAREIEELKATPPDKREDLRCVISDLCQQVRDRDAEIAHWKNNHETEVRRARILKERTDMPIERVQAYEKWGKDLEKIKELRAALVHISEVTNDYLRYGGSGNSVIEALTRCKEVLCSPKC
jgi:chromosome segregation ATPase